MRKSRIIVLKNSSEKPSGSEDDLVVTFEELRSWLMRGTYFRHVFAYREAVLLTYRLNLLTRPLLTALLLRLFTYRGCQWQDETGCKEPIGVRLLTVLLAKLCKEWVSKRR